MSKRIVRRAVSNIFRGFDLQTIERENRKKNCFN